MSDFIGMDELVEKCDYDTKLAVTAWVMKHIVAHARDNGSYRYLIYERLGFDMDAYGVLLDDGMVISNEFDLNIRDTVVEAYKRGDESALKHALRLCDEPGCFLDACSGTPTDEGYRWTCSKHYPHKE